MIMMKSRSRLTGTAVGAGILLLLTACTGSNSSSTSSTTAAASGSGSAAQAPSGNPSSANASSSATSSAAAQGGINITIAPDVEDVGDLAPDAYSTTPIPEAQITAAIDQVDGIAQNVMTQSGIPGMAVAVVHGGKVVFAKGYGVREVGKPDLIDENTVFQLASVSKSVGASVIAHAVGEGTVKWTDPVVKYLPDFQLSDQSVTPVVTIGDLYSHRSGIPAGAGDDLEGIGFTREQIIEKLRYYPLNPFRISYGYTNFGMTTGGEAVAAAAGKSWEDLSQELLYEPLGMTTTSSRYADYVAQRNRAIIHFNDNGTFKALYIRDADAQSPAGGVSSTVNDMAKWMEMNLASGKVNGEQVIDADALLAGHTPQVVNHRAEAPDERSRFYGYGVNVETTSTGQVKWGTPAPSTSAPARPTRCSLEPTWASSP